MLAIEVEYLLGRSVATDTSSRHLTEWPPHPTRLFSAFVDALADVNADSSADPTRCEAALRWLEQLPAPSIAASLGSEVSVRSPVKYWVPINDETAEKVRAAPLVDQRKRQERFFPTAVPTSPTVTFVWPTADPTAHADALDCLAARVPYLGHSSSVVRVARRASAPAPSLEPTIDGPDRLRVPGPGRLDRLNAVHALRKTDTLVQPPKGREVPYRRVRPVVSHGPHGVARVVALDDVSLGLESTSIVTSRYRAALLSLLGEKAPEVLTGHGANGEPAQRPHVAFVPLAHVEHRYSDGSIKGIAVVLPRDADDEDVLLLELAMARLRALNFGERGQGALRALGAHRGLKALDFDRYRALGTSWASVTPVAISVHPKPKKGLTEERALVRDFEHLGLPAPVELALPDTSLVRGAPRARAMSRRGVTSVSGRILRHVYVRFPQVVEGPILVGAGRHLGFGLLRPLEEV